MIDAKELRIGNKVHSPYHNLLFATVDGLLPNNNLVILKEVSTYDTFDNIVPIPLNPEVLEACGFVNGGVHDGGKSSWRRKEFPFGIDFPSVYYYDDGHCIECTHIEYLHQLQNLFFALTKTDLEVSLNEEKV